MIWVNSLLRNTTGLPSAIMEDSDYSNFFAKLLVFPASKISKNNHGGRSDQSVPNYSALSSRNECQRESHKRRDVPGGGGGRWQRVPRMDSVTVSVSASPPAATDLSADEQRVPPTQVDCGEGSGEESCCSLADRYIQPVEAFKCSLCGFISESSQAVQRHINNLHLSDCTPSGEASDSEEKQRTRTCFVCGRCSSPFASLLDVRSHIHLGECRRGVGRPMKTRAEVMILERVEPPPPPPSSPPPSSPPPPSPPPHSREGKEEEGDYGRWKDKRTPDKSSHATAKSSQSGGRGKRSGRGGGGHGGRCKKSTTCPDCGQTLSDTKALKKHVMCVHGRVRQYRCQVCAFSSTTRNSLTLHSRQHTGEKPFSCTHCHFKSSDKNTMRRHELRHTGEKPYRCDECCFAAIQSSALKTHLLTLHPDSDLLLKCAHCRFTTLSQLLLQRHLKVNHQGGRRTNSNKNQDTNFSAMFPSSKNKSGKAAAVEDEESVSQCFSEASQIDTGGITIPAEAPPAASSSLPSMPSLLAEEKSEGKLLGVIDGVPVPCEETMPLA